MKKILLALFIIACAAVLYPLVAGAATSVPWIRNGTNLYIPYSNDYVGIGTSTPVGALHIQSTSSFPLRVTNASTTKASTTLLNLNSSGVFTANAYGNVFSNYDYLPLNRNDQGAKFSYGTSSTSFDGTISMGNRRNIWQYTEDFASSRYTVANNMVKTGETTTWNGITLSGASTTGSFQTSIRSQYSTLGLSDFIAGKKYMFSYYIMNRQDFKTLKSPETLVWMHPMATHLVYSHGPHLIDGTVRRIWKVCEAISSSTLDCMTDPTVEMGTATSTVTGDIYWLQGGFTENSTTQNLNLYVGGFQIEEVPDERVGVAIVGDSTITYGSGNIDSTLTRNQTAYAAGLMNVPWFNRATAGGKCSDLDSAWSTLVAPALVNSKYMVIQCGINDSNQLVSTSTTRAAILSMYAKAEAAGSIPVVMTITPYEGTTATQQVQNEVYRSDTNDWIKTTFPRVLDVASVLQDYNATTSLNRANSYFGDGIHYVQKAHRLMGDYIARSYVGNSYGYPQIWEFPQPSNYQKIATTTYTASTSLEINGDLSVTGKFKDSASATGTSGMLLSSTGTSTLWVATSTVKIPLSNLAATIDSNTIENEHAQTWNWNTIDDAYGLTMNADGLSSGGLIKLNSTSGSLVGALLDVNASSTAAVDNGYVNFDFTGLHGGVGFQINDYVTEGVSTQIVAPQLTTGRVLSVESNNTSSTGNLLYVTSASTNSFTNGGVRFNFTGNRPLGNGFQVNDISASSTTVYINNTSIASGTALYVVSTSTARKTSVVNSYGAGAVLYVDGSGANGNIIQMRDSTNTCTSNAGGTGVTWSCTSDSRFKKNILYSESILDQLNKLKIRQYDWTTDGSHEAYGLVAQEVLGTPLKWLVTKDDSNGYYSVREVDTIMLVKAIQELSAKVEKLEKELKKVK